MAFFQGSNIVTKDLQIAIDFASSRCYSGTGTQFNNLIRPRNSVGYLKNTATYSTTNRGIITTGGYNSGAVYNVGDRIDINTTAGGIDRFSGTHNFSIFFWVNQISSSGRIMSTGSAGTGTGNSDNCIWQCGVTRGSSIGGIVVEVELIIYPHQVHGIHQVIGNTLVSLTHMMKVQIILLGVIQMEIYNFQV
jgi:hypothetical protein